MQICIQDGDEESLTGPMALVAAKEKAPDARSSSHEERRRTLGTSQRHGAQATKQVDF
jgi:hypothetical protein